MDASVLETVVVALLGVTALGGLVAYFLSRAHRPLRWLIQASQAGVAALLLWVTVHLFVGETSSGMTTVVGYFITAFVLTAAMGIGTMELKDEDGQVIEFSDAMRRKVDAVLAFVMGIAMIVVMVRLVDVAGA